MFQPKIAQINNYFPLLLKPSYIHIHISQVKDQLLSPCQNSGYLLSLPSVKHRHTHTTKATPYPTLRLLTPGFMCLPTLCSFFLPPILKKVLETKSNLTYIKTHIPPYFQS